jgi:hypothetical protein
LIFGYSKFKLKHQMRQAPIAPSTKRASTKFALYCSGCDQYHNCTAKNDENPRNVGKNGKGKKYQDAWSWRKKPFFRYLSATNMA